eukprot:11651133-Alexandrium_andersonii.AAC.1
MTRFGICAEKRRRAHHSGASGSNSEAVLGPALFRFRTPEAILQFRHCRLRIEAACSADGP